MNRVLGNGPIPGWLMAATILLGSFFGYESCSATASVVAEYGYYHFQEGTFGKGSFWRGTVYKYSPVSTRRFLSFEPGLGVCYYRMNNIDLPPGISAPLSNQSGTLKDYFVYFAGRVNLAIAGRAALYAGGRLGLHYADWDFQGDGGGTPPVRVYYKDKYEAMGLDAFAGLRVEPSRLPIGAQIEFGTTNPFEEIGGEVPFAWGVAAGLYVKF